MAYESKPVNHNFFINIDTEVQAYWLGFMFADGNIYQSADGRKQVRFYQADSGVVQRFALDIKSEHKIYRASNKWGDWSILNFTSEVMFDSLERLGCTQKKSMTLQPPAIDLGTLTRHFIRGYNDGDGGIYIKGKNSARLRMRGTFEFLSWIKDQLPSGALVYDYTPTAQLFIIRKKALYDAIHYLYDDSTVYLENKYHSAMTVLESLVIA